MLMLILNIWTFLIKFVVVSKQLVCWNSMIMDGPAMLYGYTFDEPNGPVCFAEKTSRNTVPSDLL